MQTAPLIVYVYAVLVIIGGIIGFAKAGSCPSLIGGILGGLVLLMAGYGLSHVQAWGLPLALILIFALLVFFAVRYARTRTLMPAGLMVILSLLALVGVWLAAHGR